MRERINRLAKGVIDSEIPILYITPEEVKETVSESGQAQNEILVISGNNLYIKGLAYSSNSRVRIMDSAFGGLRNRISYEVDGRYLNSGDEIRGSFYLVTNGGEFEIPYSFTLQDGETRQLLSSFTNPASFAATAKEDWNRAIRLFEHQDFVKAPFMQELRTRTIYDGLKGHASRMAQLEQFLLALDVKEPSLVTVSDKKFSYSEVGESFTDRIEMKLAGWGYIQIEVSSDVEFIELPYKVISNHEFQDGICNFLFRVNAAKMHAGKNTGRIFFRFADKTIVVEVEVLRAGKKRKEYTKATEAYVAYHKLKVAETSGQEQADTYAQKLRLLEIARTSPMLSGIAGLFAAEELMKAGHKDQALEVLGQCKGGILNHRQEKVEEYCFYQYLLLKIYDQTEQRESLKQLLEKYYTENASLYRLRIIKIHMDMEDGMGASDCYQSMKEAFSAGCSSPYLYREACSLFNLYPELIHVPGAFEIQTLFYGARYHYFSIETAVRIGESMSLCKEYGYLYETMLTMLYSLYKDDVILSALLSLMIRADRRDSSCFLLYREGVRRKIGLTRLYEYYLFSLPEDYRQALPKELLLYFSYDRELDVRTREIIYDNVLSYFGKESSIYKTYEKDMEEFAVSQLLASRINRHLAVIYSHMIYKDMIDQKIAMCLPSILRSYRIRVSRTDMKYVIVRYEELEEEDAYSLKDGIAYIPLFSDRSVILFQDAYGNRFSKESYTKIPVMDLKEFENRCYEMYPEHPMLRLKKCSELVTSPLEKAEDVHFIEKTLKDISVQPLYRGFMMQQILSYYQSRAVRKDIPITERDMGFLLTADKSRMNQHQRIILCETLVDRDYIQEAFDLLEETGYEDMDAGRLEKMCSRLILDRLFDQNTALIYMAYSAFSRGKYDSVLMDYLCEHYNGPSDQMAELLEKAYKSQVETYDFEERLLAQMLFSGKTDRIDEIFNYYAAKKKTSEMIVRAYFTYKSAEYFLREKEIDDQIVNYLEGAIENTTELDRIPTIYLLALTRYNAEKGNLNEKQINLCCRMMTVLLEEGYVFPYFKKMAAYMRIPDDIMDKAMIQYNGKKNAGIELQLRVLPQEKEFHSEDMKREYQGIYLKQKVLFEGETLEYRIYEQQEDEKVLVSKGSLFYEPVAGAAAYTRFAWLNRMGLCLEQHDEDTLKKEMKDYITRSAEVKELFVLSKW